MPTVNSVTLTATAVHRALKSRSLGLNQTRPNLSHTISGNPTVANTTSGNSMTTNFSTGNFCARNFVASSSAASLGAHASAAGK